jgi:fermentation-respiration switch protein FrsA (DUF1100 family)
MKPIIISVVLVCASVYLLVAGYLYLFQRDYLYFPYPNRPDARLVDVSSLKEVQLVTSDGIRLLAWYVPPPAQRPVVLYFHGNAGTIENRAHWLLEFANAGFGVLMPEYRGYGGNRGQPTESGLYADGVSAMDFLTNEGIAADRIVIYGESLGTAVATYLASQHRVAALLLEAPYTSITAAAARHYWFLPVSLLLHDRFDSLSRIAQVRSPILIMQGGRDQIVPPELGIELFVAAPEPKELWSVPQGGHENLYGFGAPETVSDFLRRHVPGLEQSPTPLSSP